jgi:hypothetical protein
MNKKVFKRNQYGMKDDIHVLTAQWCTLKNFDAITSFDREHKGKRARHAGNYDMEAFRFSYMIHLSIKECQEILNRFHQFSPKIRAILKYSSTIG